MLGDGVLLTSQGRTVPFGSLQTLAPLQEQKNVVDFLLFHNMNTISSINILALVHALCVNKGLCNYSPWTSGISSSAPQYTAMRLSAV